MITVSMGGCGAGAPVTVELHSPDSTPVLLDTFLASSSGTVSEQVLIPTTTIPGDFQIVASCLSDNGTFERMSTPLEVLGAAGAAGTGGSGAGAPGTGTGPLGGVNLPRTGAEIALVALTGAGLAGAGAASVYAGRRRRRLA